MRRELTGRHVLGITVGAFGIIIAVNLYMASQAVGTFPGLEVSNSYVASQSFDRERAAQEALNWTVRPSYDGKVMELKITDAQNLPVKVEDLRVTIGRPTHVREDQSPVFTFQNGVYTAPVALAPGAWNIHLSAKAADGTVFRQRLDHYHGARVE
ncbi:FixH family protein [Paracoccus aminophilus]|uniref:Cbb3-type cytochrome c oxidase, biogenesis protein CcoH n=1 Tax=Paracoccus aminophilus JCM 7686 TaxID=1367847 RepID=S5XSW0_PARAH|nr:FixH family protein [Paracoccus aminophilus]AGT08222.1 cbb3-type cytochrome c oxidase, biogenesis protein CcoH [Paracoccus aminophilus JCM 7686]